MRWIPVFYFKGVKLKTWNFELFVKFMLYNLEIIWEKFSEFHRLHSDKKIWNALDFVKNFIQTFS